MPIHHNSTRDRFEKRLATDCTLAADRLLDINGPELGLLCSCWRIPALPSCFTLL